MSPTSSSFCIALSLHDLLGFHREGLGPIRHGHPRKAPSLREQVRGFFVYRSLAPRLKSCLLSFAAGRSCGTALKMRS